jgi:hypothetical protein
MHLLPLAAFVYLCMSESLKSKAEDGCQRAEEPAAFRSVMGLWRQKTGVQAKKESRA